MNYKPLPDSLTIKNSDIEGLGLFAKENIPKGTRLGVTHHIVDKKLIRTPLGGFYNHSQTPNSIKRSDDSTNTFYLEALRDIESGEEITVRYTFYDPTK